MGQEGSAPSAESSELTPEAEAELQAFAKSLPIMGPRVLTGQAMLFDLESGKLLKTYRRFQDHLRHVRFSPDDTHALLSYYNYSVLWNSETGAKVREFDQGGIAAFSADGAEVLIYGEFVAHRYDVATGEKRRAINLVAAGGWFKGRDTRNNAHLANEIQRDSSGSLIYQVKPGGGQSIVDAVTGQRVGRCPANAHWCFVAGATGRVLQGGPTHPQNVVRLFDFQEQEVARFDMPSGDLLGVGGYLKAVSSDGKQFLYAYHVKGGAENPGPQAEHRTLQYSLYDAGTGKELTPLGKFDTAYTATFSPDGVRTLLLPTFGHAGSDIRDPEILVINNATGAVEQRLYTGPWSLPSLDFDSTGKRLLVAGAMNFGFWRRFADWTQLEQTSPMPRKVADMLRIIAEAQGKKLGTAE